MKKPFLTACDYGEGAVWQVVLADSKKQIADRFPALSIVPHPPEWMDDSTRWWLDASAEDIDQI
jgi:hypothetical protein